MTLLDVLQEKLTGKNVKIVLPEGEDERVLEAATQLQGTDYVSPILLGNESNIKALASDKGLEISDLEIIDPETSELKQELVTAFVERRKGKATEEDARKILKQNQVSLKLLVFSS